MKKSTTLSKIGMLAVRYHDAIVDTNEADRALRVASDQWMYCRDMPRKPNRGTYNWQLMQGALGVQKSALQRAKRRERYAQRRMLSLAAEVM